MALSQQLLALVTDNNQSAGIRTQVLAAYSMVLSRLNAH